MTDTILLDHLAIGVRRWSDGYSRFAVELGGRWAHGGDAGAFAPCQLTYRHGMRVELISAGSDGGFMNRFFERRGPGAHHLTFIVPSLEGTLAEVAEIGIGTMGGRSEVPFWKEAFLHPKAGGVGTLVQVVEKDAEEMDAILADSVAPEDFPVERGEPAGIAWVGLTVDDLGATRTLFLDVLRGEVRAAGPGWMLMTWGPGASLLVREAAATPASARLWVDAPDPGVAHLLMGPADLLPGDVDEGALAATADDPRVGLPVWTAHGAGRA